MQEAQDWGALSPRQPWLRARLVACNAHGHVAQLRGGSAGHASGRAGAGRRKRRAGGGCCHHARSSCGRRGVRDVVRGGLHYVAGGLQGEVAFWHPECMSGGGHLLLKCWLAALGHPALLDLVGAWLPGSPLHRCHESPLAPLLGAPPTLTWEPRSQIAVPGRHRSSDARHGGPRQAARGGDAAPRPCGAEGHAGFPQPQGGLARHAGHAGLRIQPGTRVLQVAAGAAGALGGQACGRGGGGMRRGVGCRPHKTLLAPRAAGRRQPALLLRCCWRDQVAGRASATLRRAPALPAAAVADAGLAGAMGVGAPSSSPTKMLKSCATGQAGAESARLPMRPCACQVHMRRCRCLWPHRRCAVAPLATGGGAAAPLHRRRRHSHRPPQPLLQLALPAQLRLLRMVRLLQAPAVRRRLLLRRPPRRRTAAGRQARQGAAD
jgi:hypothetical protein